MGTLCSELAKEGHLSLSLRKSPSSFIIKMVDNVETTTPTIEEVAAPVADNGEAEPAVTEEVKTSENGANGTHEETKEPEVSPPTEPLTKLRRRRKPPRKPPRRPPRRPLRRPLRKPQRGKLTLPARRRQWRRLPS